MSLAGLFAFHLLTNPNLCPLQQVSVPCWLVCFPCSDQSQPLPSPTSERHLLACLLSMFCPIPTSRPSRHWVSLPGLFAFPCPHNPNLTPRHVEGFPPW